MNNSFLKVSKNLLDHEGALVLLLVYILQEPVNDNGIQIGAAQQVLITHTELFVAHLFKGEHGSNNEQITSGAHIDVLRDVSKL